jgi:ATP/maltotriose-dependent transcriptional regulator MalT
MTRRSALLAKLTRPRLHEAVERDRLFDRLDQARGRKSTVCIVGPPGAGKTTLVATWLDGREIPGIWYQVDAGDADLATFFYYLGEASRPFRRKDQPALPLLTPEYQHDVAGFSRRFFRELYGLLPEDAAMVLDNYQEVDARHPFHGLVADAIAELSAERMLMVVSRRDPPDCYARLMANEHVEMVDWDDLKLDLKETTAIAQARLPGVATGEIERLYDRSGGWAAGLTLMLEAYRRSNGVSPDLPTERESIFAYFAEQIFERLPDATREFLVATAVLPQVAVSLAKELTGNLRASEILEDLYKRHLFTHRRPGPEPTYWYHALFRSFLNGRPLEYWDWRRCAKCSAERLACWKHEGVTTMRISSSRKCGTGLRQNASSSATPKRCWPKAGDRRYATGSWRCRRECSRTHPGRATGWVPR